MATMLSLVPAVLILLCVFYQAQASPAADELTFPMLRDTWNATRQWRLALATGNQNSPIFTPVNCSNPALDACTSTNPPLQQDTGDLLRVSYTLATPRGADGSLLTYKGMQPTQVQIRICHTLLSSTDRAWRKKNKAYPRLSQNCPRTAATLPFNGTSTTPDLVANTGVVYWDLNEEDEIPTSTWFVMMWVWCGDQVCAFESQEGRTDVTPPLPGNFFQTDVELGITPSMRAAAIILSIIGPSFFVLYFAADQYWYKTKGRPMRPF